MRRALGPSLLLALLALCGCAGVKYSDQPATAVDLTEARTRTVSSRVLGKAEEWRNSGIMVRKGATYGITANGRWTAGGTCSWTDADGTGAFNALCWDVPGMRRVREWSVSALIAKVGEGGAPFGVGKSLQFTAQADGVLYFSMNDSTGLFGDNDGYLDVTVALAGQAEGTATAQAQPQQQQAAPPAPPPPPAAPNAVPAAQAGRRLALVIGNGAYPEAPLANPRNDARDIATALRALGFEVILRLDADRKGMEQAIDEFYAGLKKGGAGLFYFAGHGLQVAGVNYLMPIGARIASESDVRFEAVDAGRVLGKMEDAGNGMNIVILDACRNNPFARSFRSAQQGLARMDAPTGSIIAYATAPGSVAADGQGRNGVYTEQLLRAIRTSGQPVETMFKRVRDEVMRATRDRQVPWESTSLRGDFFFAP